MPKNNKNKTIQSQSHYKKNKDIEYAIKNIKNVRFNTLTNHKQYQIQWEPSEGVQWQNTWEPQDTLHNISMLQFYQQKKKKKQQKQKEKMRARKIHQQELIREYQIQQSALNQEILKTKNVSLQKMKQLRQNKERLYRNLYNKSSRGPSKPKKQQNSNLQRQSSIQPSQTLDLIIDKITGLRKKSNNIQYFEIQTIDKHKYFVSQISLTKLFPEKFMQFLEQQQKQFDQNFSKSVSNTQQQNYPIKDQFESQMQKSRKANKSFVMIATNENFLNKNNFSKDVDNEDITKKLQGKVDEKANIHLNMDIISQQIDSQIDLDKTIKRSNLLVPVQKKQALNNKPENIFGKKRKITDSNSVSKPKLKRAQFQDFQDLLQKDQADNKDLIYFGEEEEK